MTLFSQSESAITIDGPAGRLEAKVAGGREDGVLADQSYTAVICHPHPQHGGTMENKVVSTLSRTYRDLGAAAVRFNFRGVGRSAGEYDRAVGEVDDLLAVIEWLAESGLGAEPKLLLAGFSFGSAVAAAAVYRSGWAVEQLTLIAPPVERYAYAQKARFPCPVVVAQGGQDDVVDSEGVARWCQALESPCELLAYPEAGHFFHGGLTTLKRDLMETIPTQLQRPGASR